MAPDTAAITAVMTVEGVDRDALKNALLQVLVGMGARLLPCDWSPDPDTIADACGRDHVFVLDLNPARPREVEMLVGIDAERIEDVYRARVDPTDRWNGWLNPRFPREEAERIVQNMSSPPIAHPEEAIILSWDGDVVVVADRPGTDDEYIERIEPDADGLYAIGNYGWCWSQVHIPEGMDPAEAFRRDHAEAEIYRNANNEALHAAYAEGKSAPEAGRIAREAARKAVEEAGGPWRERL